jgi:hypothetical protein
MVHLLWRNWKRRGFPGKANATDGGAPLQAKSAGRIAETNPDALNAIWPR